MSERLGHLKKLEIRGLFDSKNYVFDLDLKEPTLLTGSNGSGKSSILRIVNAVGMGAWRHFLSLPVRSASLEFEHGTIFTLEKSTTSKTALVATLNGRKCEFDAADTLDYTITDEELLELVPGLTVAGSTMSGSMYLYRGEYVDRRELFTFLPDALSPRSSQDGFDAITDFAENFHLLFVTDQRLVVSEEKFGSPRHRPTRTANRTAADLSAREIGRQMQKALSDYASVSQRFDRDFPNRVVKAMASEEEVPVDRIERLLRDVEREREALQKVGLLPRDLSSEAFQGLPLHEISVRPVIETFITDTKRKFETLADLRERLTLFAEFLNQHYENKRVVTSPKDGFKVEIDGDPERTIGPAQLSSGEQQMLVLAFEILFHAEPGTLVLIDEPELSLHVLWQDTFIDDLSRMGAVRDLQFILATHSPSLIGGRDDLKRTLDAR
ncbi:AAA family ATPase [Microbispora hainanensis]|uniref:AAA family ATPase n=1 Tax=Microbispora hainanensis TaxID=568844 RepID=UPI0033CC017D